MSMEIKLTDDQLRALVADTLFHKIDPAERERLVKSALDNLLKKDPDYNSIYHRKSRLQTAIDDALTQVAVTVCREELAKLEVKEQLRGLVQEALQRITDTDREKSVERLCLSLAHALAHGFVRE